MMKKRAKELLSSGEVTRVIGWKKNEFDYEPLYLNVLDSDGNVVEEKIVISNKETSDNEIYLDHTLLSR